MNGSCLCRSLVTLWFFLGNAPIGSRLARGYHAAESAAPEGLVLETTVVKSNVAPPAGCKHLGGMFKVQI